MANDNTSVSRQRITAGKSELPNAIPHVLLLTKDVSWILNSQSISDPPVS